MAQHPNTVQYVQNIAEWLESDRSDASSRISKQCQSLHSATGTADKTLVKEFAAIPEQAQNDHQP